MSRRRKRRPKTNQSDQYFNEGKLAAITGGRCPYADDFRRDIWLSGYREERDLAQIREQLRRQSAA